MMRDDRANGEKSPSDSLRPLKRARLIRELAGGFPSRPAAKKTPRKQAGHMKATDLRRRQKALARGGVHT